MSNSLDADQAGHFVWPDLVPNYLQKLSEEDTLVAELILDIMGLFARKPVFPFQTK